MLLLEHTLLPLTPRKFHFGFYGFYGSHTSGFYLSLYPAATVHDKAVQDQQQHHIGHDHANL